jgi:hypothetical protein
MGTLEENCSQNFSFLQKFLILSDTFQEMNGTSQAMEQWHMPESELTFFIFSADKNDNA